MAAASSSASFFGIRDEEYQNNQIQHPPPPPPPSSTPTSSTATATATATAPQKKKRNLPGNPNPDAEVIALSPKTLLATNRFVCEVCNKGFQREQNLQLHRRGHNLPWKLRQKSTKEVRRKVYLCPEPTCVHHEPSRALGDLTGIKKHFCRKHGEKKWKCDKCSKRYAVQSDWKAHSKTCGTREYRCDCGTLFSRRDSFITHRAFCDALAQESVRLPATLNTMGSHLYGNSSIGLSLQSQVNSQIQDQTTHSSADILRLGGASGSAAQFEHLISQSNPPPFRQPQMPPSSGFYLGGGSNQDFHDETQSNNPLLQSKPFHGLMQLPNLHSNNSTSASSPANAAANLFNISFSDQFGHGGGNAEQMSLFSGNLMGDHMGGGGGMSSLYNTSTHNESVIPQMSATALLQKAAQMGATTSGGGGGINGSSLLSGFAGSSKSAGNYRGESLRSQMESETNLQNLMNSLANGSAGMFGGPGGGHEEETGFGGGFNPAALCNIDRSNLNHHSASGGGIGGGSDGLTRDFLGVGSVVRSLGGGISQREQQHHMGSLDSELRSGSSSGGARSFAGGSLQ